MNYKCGTEHILVTYGTPDIQINDSKVIHLLKRRERLQRDIGVTMARSYSSFIQNSPFVLSVMRET